MRSADRHAKTRARATGAAAAATLTAVVALHCACAGGPRGAGRPGSVIPGNQAVESPGPPGETTRTRAGAEGEMPRTISLREPGSPFVAFSFWIRAGSQDDPPGKEGLAAVTGSMLASGGTEEDDYQTILARLYPMAASYGVQVDKEMTVVTGRVHRDNLEEFYRLIRNAVVAPAFDKRDFARVKERAVTDVERRRRFGHDEELSKEILMREAFRGTPYEHPAEGYASSVRSITLEDVRAFYREHVRSGNVVVAVGGDYPEGFAERVRADIDGALPPGAPARTPAPQPAPPHGIHVIIADKETDATAISIGYPIDLLRGDDDFFPMMLLNSWLGEHRNSFSHLYQVIRLKRGMNYGDYTYIEAFPRGYDTGQPRCNVPRRHQLFEIWIRPVSQTSPGDLHDRALFAVRAALREVDLLVKNGMSEEQFALAQNFLRDYTVNYGSTLDRRLGYAVDDAFYGMRDPGFLASIRPALASLTRARVNAALRRYLRTGDLWIVLVTRDAEGLERKLLSGEATPITYAGEKPEAQLEEDRVIASYPLPVKEENIRIVPIDQVLEN